MTEFQPPYLESLNEAQREAVVYSDGPQLVIAGAGSGKTRVITCKIAHLLAQGVEPWRIMALTFTNKAAREMRERIGALAGEDVARKLWMGTFHSIFARILRNHAELLGYKSSYTIYDTADSRALIKSIVRAMDLDEKLYKPAVVASDISTAKNALISPEAYALDRELTEADRRARRPRTAEIYRAYRDRCQAADAMDFDDLLYYTNVLLRDNPDVLRHYQEFFSYVLVDEYQDTNFAQHLIVSQLTQRSQRLCVVGDDSQSIYSFRGANIRNILNLRNAYPTLQVFKLEQNYRSTGNILGAANTLIAKNREGIPKEVFTTGGEGNRIEVVRAYSDYEEGFLVANRLSQVRMNSGDSYEEFAILYRTNAQSRILEEALRKRNIPYRIYGGLAFYQRKEIKDAVAYLRLSVNPDDDEALRRIINTPARGIGETTLKKVTAAAMRDGVSLWQVLSDAEAHPLEVNRGTRAKLDRFHDLIFDFVESAATMPADRLAEHIITRTQLISNLMHDKTPESISQIENLGELLNGVRQFVADKQEEGAERADMASFLSEVSLATDQDGKDPDDGVHERVTLMTIHAAKGLEFGNVFIVGVEEELLPSAMSYDSPMGVEEERRLMYVALTRAKRFCMISYAGSRFINGQTKICQPSRFLRDIDPRFLRMTSGTTIAGPSRPAESFRSSFHSPAAQMPARPRTAVAPPQRAAAPAPAAAPGEYTLHSSSEMAPGMAIEHSRFGRGTVLEVDTSELDHRISVQFDEVEKRVLLLKFARFKILK
ncbi:MAG: UvrD-helicase domain-containing protein [Muribaculaceae bacterium]|nr:UvrD-helicase domain-containing protein [Muribaculaceae bacterium]